MVPARGRRPARCGRRPSTTSLTTRWPARRRSGRPPGRAVASLSPVVGQAAAARNGAREASNEGSRRRTAPGRPQSAPAGRASRVRPRPSAAPGRGSRPSVPPRPARSRRARRAGRRPTHRSSSRRWRTPPRTRAPVPSASARSVATSSSRNAHVVYTSGRGPEPQHRPRVPGAVEPVRVGHHESLAVGQRIPAQLRAHVAGRCHGRRRSATTSGAPGAAERRPVHDRRLRSPSAVCTVTVRVPGGAGGATTAAAQPRDARAASAIANGHVARPSVAPWLTVRRRARAGMPRGSPSLGPWWPARATPVPQPPMRGADRGDDQPSDETNRWSRHKVQSWPTSRSPSAPSAPRGRSRSGTVTRPLPPPPLPSALRRALRRVRDGVALDVSEARPARRPGRAARRAARRGRRRPRRRAGRRRAARASSPTPARCSSR